MPRYLLVAILFLVMLAPAALNAQESRDDRSSLLPDIDPQDIEIRGDFRARFAGISRQPILGFSPSPRVFRIDPNRMPFMETPEEVMASMPLSDLEPQLGPPRDLREYPDASHLFGYAGLGNFLSPEAQLWFGVPVTQRSRVTGNINFFSSEGHLQDYTLAETNSGLGFEGAFRRLDGDLTFHNRLTPNGTLLFNLRGRSDFSEVNPERYTNPQSSLIQSGRSPELNVIGGGAGWISQTSVYDRLEVFADYSGTFIDSKLDTRSAVNPDFVFETIEHTGTEHRISTGVGMSWAGNRIGDVFSFEIDGEYALFDAESSIVDTSIEPLEWNYDWYLAGAGAYWQRELNTGHRMKLGVRAFGGYDQTQEALFMAYPYLSYEIRTGGPLSLKAELTGRMQNRGLEQAFVDNRTVLYPNELLNERVFYGDLQTQYQLSSEFAVQGGLYISYTLRPLMYSFNGWTQPEDLFLVRPSAGFTFNVRPRVLTAYGEAHMNITDMSERFFQNRNFEGFDEFAGLEEYRLTAGLRSTPFEHAVFKFWADYIGPRTQYGFISSSFQTDLRQVDYAGQALLLNVQAEYRINGTIGFYVKALNLLNESYEMWNGYEERPLQVFGGITFNF